jgi:hypothetical protein
VSPLPLHALSLGATATLVDRWGASLRSRLNGAGAWAQSLSEAEQVQELQQLDELEEAAAAPAPAVSAGVDEDPITALRQKAAAGAYEGAVPSFPLTSFSFIWSIIFCPYRNRK